MIIMEDGRGMWVTAKEMRMFYDFGYIPLYHDITGYTSDMSQESFDVVVNASAQEFFKSNWKIAKNISRTKWRSYISNFQSSESNNKYVNSTEWRCKNTICLFIC